MSADPIHNHKRDFKKELEANPARVWIPLKLIEKAKITTKKSAIQPSNELSNTWRKNAPVGGQKIFSIVWADSVPSYKTNTAEQWHPSCPIVTTKIGLCKKLKKNPKKTIHQDFQKNATWSGWWNGQIIILSKFCSCPFFFIDSKLDAKQS